MMKLKTAIALVLIVSASTVIATNKSEHSLWKKALKIHQKAITVDTHTDTPLVLRDSSFNIAEKHSVSQSQVDLPRMKEGGLDAQFFAVFTAQKPRTEENYREVYDKADRMLKSIHSVVEKNSDQAELALTADDASRIERSGKRAIYIGMENGFPIAKDLSRVQEFYNRGVRYITLCHSYHNDICDSSSDTLAPEHNGVSEFGKTVIAKMNQLGMMVDVSHMSDQSFFDVLKYSKAPVIASHSSVRSICNHNRNMSDEMIKALAEKGGVIQICLVEEFVKKPDTVINRKNIFYSGAPTVKDLVDHIDYVKNLVGVDYIGIGSDFDGGGGLADCSDVSQFPNITYELLKRGYTEDEIEKIWGGNFLRVFKKVEDVARQLD